MYLKLSLMMTSDLYLFSDGESTRLLVLSKLLIGSIARQRLQNISQHNAVCSFITEANAKVHRNKTAKGRRSGYIYWEHWVKQSQHSTVNKLLSDAQANTK